MFERYTERARRVLFFARYEASQLGRISIETEHLLLGLLREGKGITSRIFARAHLSPDTVRKEIEERMLFQEKLSTSVEIPFSAEAKRVLQFAAEEADRLLHNYIGTEHLLLGILREERSVAASILLKNGIRLHTVREDIVQLLNEKTIVTREVAGRRFDGQPNTKLALAALLRVPPHRIDAPAQLDIPLTITRESRVVDAYVLTHVSDRIPEPTEQAPGGGVGFGSMQFSMVAGTPHPPAGAASDRALNSIGPLSMSGVTMNELALMLEDVLEMPVIDETRLEGRYRIDVSGPHDRLETFLAALSEDAGLRLTRAKREIELFVVRCG